MEKIDLKYIWQMLLHKKKALILGQIVTLMAILLSVPVPLLLPALVDEVLLDQPNFFVNNINSFFGEGNAFYYIATYCNPVVN